MHGNPTYAFFLWLCLLPKSSEDGNNWGLDSMTQEVPYNHIVIWWTKTTEVNRKALVMK